MLALAVGSSRFLSNINSCRTGALKIRGSLGRESNRPRRVFAMVFKAANGVGWHWGSGRAEMMRV
jgi:hypothetical protein